MHELDLARRARRTAGQAERARRGRRLGGGLAVALLAMAVALVGLGTAPAQAADVNGPGGRIPATGTEGKADPFPSTVTVSGLSGSVSRVEVVIRGLTHTYVGDLRLLLVSPSGARSIVLGTLLPGSDQMGVNNLTVRVTPDGPEVPSFLDSTAPLGAGPYRPTDHADLTIDGYAPPFPAPAPAPGATGRYPVDFTVFNGSQPNGTWSLFAIDTQGDDHGSFSGWTLSVTSGAGSTTTTTQPAVPDPAWPASSPCWEASTGVGFSDVTTANVHERNVACLAGMEITRGGPGGLPADQYGPRVPTRRDQMASFVARVASAYMRLDYDNYLQTFDDVPPDNTHFEAVHALYLRGILQGTGAVIRERPVTYFPARVINRAEMAQFLYNLIDDVVGVPPSTRDFFSDDAGHPNEAAINGLASLGIVLGTGGGAYDPGGDVRRDSMASFLVRTVNHLVEATSG